MHLSPCLHHISLNLFISTLSLSYSLVPNPPLHFFSLSTPPSVPPLPFLCLSSRSFLSPSRSLRLLPWVGERQTGRKCVMKRPYRAHCPNWPGMNGVTDQLVLKLCRWRSKGEERLGEKMKLPNAAAFYDSDWELVHKHVYFVYLVIKVHNQLVNIVLLLGSSIWNNRKKKFFPPEIDSWQNPWI